MKVYTIGFSKKNARTFFEMLKKNGIQQLLDVRLNNKSQLAGYTRVPDLEYFLEQICGARYRHLTELAPTRELMDSYKKHKVPWRVYERDYLLLLQERRVQETLEKNLFQLTSVLLCSEPTPEQCHRRLVLQYLQEHWDDLQLKVVHL